MTINIYYCVVTYAAFNPLANMDLEPFPKTPGTQQALLHEWAGKPGQVITHLFIHTHTSSQSNYVCLSFF